MDEQQKDLLRDPPANVALLESARRARRLTAELNRRLQEEVSTL